MENNVDVLIRELGDVSRGINSKAELRDLLVDPEIDGGCGWNEHEATTFIDSNLQHVIKCAKYGLNPNDSIAYIFWKLGLSRFSPTESDVYFTPLPEIINKKNL
mgnify:CR=1 FL=1|tara:strand:+ start:244 stop:555 length:312 start_codon:yes stop_codon:yes gene_type:complete